MLTPPDGDGEASLGHGAATCGWTRAHNATHTKHWRMKLRIQGVYAIGMLGEG